MSLKILILPTFILLELIIAIAYIKPNVSAIFAKRDEIAVVQGSLARVESIGNNIQTLAGSIESQSDTTHFIDRYYPKALDEERMIDMFNFFALQAGIIVTDVGITATPFVPPPAAVDPSFGALSSEGLTPEVVAAQAEAALAVFPESYAAQVTVLGAYPNIKDFFGRLYRADRLHTIKGFSVRYREKETPAGEDAVQAMPDDFLIGSFEADFPYIVEKQVASALNNPIFESASFDFSAADKAVAFVKNPPAPIDASGGGKTNPFE
jgi:hypothetical protein